MRVSLIVAVAANGVIGRDNRLPWRLPADLKRFKTLTMGHPIIMGRKTHESLGRPLPGRTNIVVTTQPNYEAPGCQVAHSLEQALAFCQSDDEVFVIGGASLYQQALERADKIYLTEIHQEFEGDVRFPQLDRTTWQETSRTKVPASAESPLAYSFVTLEKR